MSQQSQMGGYFESQQSGGAPCDTTADHGAHQMGQSLTAPRQQAQSMPKAPVQFKDWAAI
ncbi:hypothetical protein [Albirhodobacter sp. R86504]|jgi:hypothetical protein|uniref:hypothetical protein n=1 Tax=Albirhodobacter sp. R86504 TaxID=3093848 RepID=UPI00366D5905